MSEFVVQKKFFDFVEYSTGSEYSVKKKVYHILTEIRVFWGGHNGLNYHQYLLKSFKKKCCNCDYIIGSEKNFNIVEYSTGIEYSIKKKRLLFVEKIQKLTLER